MPQYITIKNFGPITSIEKMEVKDFMLFIGERATGKSTIAKFIYFFNIVDYYIYKAILHSLDEFKIPDRLSIGQAINKRLKNYFLGVDISNNSFITFLLEDDSQILLKGVNQEWQVEFTGKLAEEIDSAFIDIKSNDIVNASRKEKSFLTYEWIRQFNLSQRYTKGDWFGIYIPSQRAILSSTEGQTILKPVRLDELTDFYITFINYHKREYNKILKGQKVYSLFNEYIRRILKGELNSFNGKDIGLKLPNDIIIELQNASSGQQESIWILLSMIFLEQGIIVIEEPESHLDPLAQSLIMEAIVLFANRSLENKPNQTIITTHSPFILNTLSNILYASKLNKEHREERKELEKLGFTPELLLNPENVAVYRCIDGRVESIMENGRINNEAVDNVSGDMLHIQDSLIDIELKYENEV